MSEKINNIRAKIESLQKEINNTLDSIRGEFQSGLKDLFIKYPKVKEINVGINNYEYNDGEPESFSLYYDDLTLIDQDDEEYDGYEEGHELEKAHDEFVNYFSTFDIDDFFETLYSEFESLEISLNKKGELVVE